MDQAERPPEEDTDGRSATASALHRAEPYLRAVWYLTGGVGLGTAGGYYADEALGTKPWLLVVGAAVGMTLGTYGFVKALEAAERRRS